MTDETKPNPWWVDSIKTLGLPTVFLCVVVYMIWQAGKYVSTGVIEPLLKTHIEFVKASTATLEQMQNNGRESLLKIESNTTETLRILKDGK